MTAEDYIISFQDKHPLCKQKKEFLLECKTMHNAWQKTECLSILHQSTINYGAISKQDYIRIAIAYTERCAYHYPLDEYIVRNAIECAIIHTLNPTANSKDKITSILTSIIDLKFKDEVRYQYLKNEINTLYKVDNFPEWQKLHIQRHVFTGVRLTTMNMIICGLGDDIKKTLNNFLACAENSRISSCLTENELQQCIIYRSIIDNPFEYIEIKPKTTIAKIASWLGRMDKTKSDP